MSKHFAQNDPVTAAARAMARLSRSSVRRVSWRMLAAAALEAARAADARLAQPVIGNDGRLREKSV